MTLPSRICLKCTFVWSSFDNKSLWSQVVDDRGSLGKCQIDWVHYTHNTILFADGAIYKSKLDSFIVLLGNGHEVVLNSIKWLDLSSKIRLHCLSPPLPCSTVDVSWNLGFHMPDNDRMLSANNVLLEENHHFPSNCRLLSSALTSVAGRNSGSAHKGLVQIKRKKRKKEWQLKLWICTPLLIIPEMTFSSSKKRKANAKIISQNILNIKRFFFISFGRILNYRHQKMHRKVDNIQKYMHYCCLKKWLLA